MRIVVGSDHRGYHVKSKVIDLVRRLGHEVFDEGTNGGGSIDYPDVASNAASKVSKQEVDRAILICGTGIGMCIAANKFPGVRGAVSRRPDGGDEPAAQRSERVVSVSRHVGREAD